MTFAHLQLVKDFSSLLLEQARLLEIAIHVTTTGEGAQNREALLQKESAIRISALMLQGMGVSCRSIVKLTEPLDMAVRDCFGIARSICECGINAAYILCDPKAAEQAESHALQKTYRDARRHVSVEGSSVKVLNRGNADFDKLGRNSDVQRSIAMFTSSKGREIMQWTPTSIEARLSVINAANAQVGLALSGAFYAIYRPASEVLHGTFYSVSAFWSERGQPVRSSEAALRLFAEKHYPAIFCSAFFSSHGICSLVSELFDVPALATASMALLTQATKAMRISGFPEKG